MSTKHSISHLRRSLALLLPVLAAMFAVACGGDDGQGNQEDADRLLDRAFRQTPTSADVKIDARLPEGALQGFQGPVRIEASGPYIARKGKLPKLDIDLRIRPQGAGQTIEAGFVSTGDRSFVKFAGQYYEQPRAAVARANRLAERRKSRGGSLGDLGLRPRDWVTGAEVEGDERVDGVDTTHVRGTLDVRRLAGDLNELAKRSAGALGGAGATPTLGLSKKDIESLAGAVEDPTFDVYVGKDDNLVRRVAAELKVKVPEEDREQLKGIEEGTLRFTVDLADVNGDQEVEAPARSRPIASLITQLGSLLGGGTAAPETQPDSGSGNGSSTAPDSGGAGPSEAAEAFKEFADCLDDTKPDDAQARARCAELLR